MHTTRATRRGVARLAGIIALVVVAAGSAGGGVSAQQGYDRISGEGSSWAAIAIDNMRADVEKYGLTVDYAATGSSAGRTAWLNGTVDFAASDIPFQLVPEDNSLPEKPEPGSYAYIPVTAGGTAFMYNLKINGERVTNLRLSGRNISRIFTGQATVWNDPEIQADNPGLTLPPRPISPIVRGDGSGSTAQFTAWMADRHGDIWGAYTSSKGLPAGATSYYPTTQGMIAANGDIGVATAIQAAYAEGAIGYVNYSYALNASFPVVKVLNSAGYYTEPTPENVAVSLLEARINTDDPNNLATYLTQDLSGVYVNDDPRNYELSSYSYFILRTKLTSSFTESKGRSVGRFASFAMCEAQQSSASLGYSPIPINLVRASFEQIRRVPGAEVPSVNVEQDCNNPTFSPDGTNLLAQNAPMPQPCDKQSEYQCATGTGGLPNTPTTTRNSEVPPAGGSGGDGSTGGSTNGGSTNGGATDGGSTNGGATNGGGGGAVVDSGGSSGGSTSGGSTTGGSTTGGSANGGDAADGTDTGSATVDGDGGAVVDDGSVVVDVDGEFAGGAADGGAVVDQSAGGVADGGSAQGGVTGAAAIEPSPLVSSVLDSKSSWSDQVGMLVLVSLLLLALLVGPVLVWRALSEDREP